MTKAEEKRHSRSKGRNGSADSEFSSLVVLGTGKTYQSDPADGEQREYAMKWKRLQYMS
jgi:hypothetical protein